MKRSLEEETSDEEPVEDKKLKVESVEDLDESLDWLPPALKDMNKYFNSITYSSPIPSFDNEPIILGVDEAGRGPILGPMVYSVAYCKKSYSEDLRKYGFDDSKVLKHDFRLQLYKLMEEDKHDLNYNIGYLTTIISAKDISSGMLRVHQGNYNLNEQAHDTTINLIRILTTKNVNIAECYVDTVGPPQSYQDKLSKIFPSIKFTVTKKADSLFPIVSCASIVAKVTRDLYLHYYNKEEKLLQGTVVGSGYPSDPNTVKWLNENVDLVFGWHFGLLRYSWQTAKTFLEKNAAVKVVYEEKEERFDQFTVTPSVFGSKVSL